ncbi:MAG: SIS domain-containing protein [Armatimonadota bacterium]|nr:SIS domain-containing protein [Armatimonadota bacterium]
MEPQALGVHMEREILEQPQSLYDADLRYREAFAALELRRYRQVVLVARGSSDNAALYLRYLIEVFLGIPAILAAPSVATMYGREVRYEGALGVAISQSGESPDVRAVVSQLRKQGHTTVAITNSPDSPLAREAEMHIDLGVGIETSIAATKTYTASLLAGYHLARALGAQLAEPILPDDAWMDYARTAAESNVGPVIESEVLFSLARGFSFARRPRNCPETDGMRPHSMQKLFDRRLRPRTEGDYWARCRSDRFWRSTRWALRFRLPHSPSSGRRKAARCPA